jgi:4'-phosphopantetheinyl transferase
LNLGANEAHVWLARLDEENAADLENIISDDERARAKRLRFDSDKKRFIAARANLRIILGNYLQTNPRKIRFEYGEFGKPAIAGESEIKFNVSHSGNLALYAVARCREVGVDIERINKSFVEDGMISQTLTGQEKAHFLALPVDKREIFFFECWTRKEAFLKACGKGFLVPPNKIETLSFSNISADFSEVGFGFQPSFWSFQAIPCNPGYAAALVTEGDSPRLKFWHQQNPNSLL